MWHRSSVALASLLLLPPPVSCHSRWSCPEPRSPSAGIKSGLCGDDDNNFSDPLLVGGGAGSIVEVKPGPLRVAFEESIHHTGAPFRISLSSEWAPPWILDLGPWATPLGFNLAYNGSKLFAVSCCPIATFPSTGDGDDRDACVLLDHIPHNDCCGPYLRDPSTYTRYEITITIPNVMCERCSLHLSNPMTDKIGINGSPSGIGCTDPGTCFSVYHSCTRPFRIVGNVDNESVLRSEYTCPDPNSFNKNWPKVWTGDFGEDADAGIPGVYRRESSIWSNHTLTTVPEQYREYPGGMCGENELLSAITRDPSTAPTIPSAKITYDGRPTVPPADVPSVSPEKHHGKHSMPAEAGQSQPISSNPLIGLEYFNGQYQGMLTLIAMNEILWWTLK
ncbi:hypothetical protein ACHAWF_002422 [Thalassiosira exigua]